MQKKLDAVNNISSSWINDFLEFLTKKHPIKVDYEDLKQNMIVVLKGLFTMEEERKRVYRFKDKHVRIITKGEICDNTINKRMDCLFQFFKYLKSINVLTLDFNESKFREKYNRYEIEISTLTFEEINMLKKFDIDFDNCLASKPIGQILL